MRMRRGLASLLAAGLLAAAMASPASAAPDGRQGPKHTSCKAYGQAFAAWAQGDDDLVAAFGTVGEYMSSEGKSAPGAVAAVIQWEHAQPYFCVQP